MANTPKRRARRQCTDEFKASAVRLVLYEGKTVRAGGFLAWQHRPESRHAQRDRQLRTLSAVNDRHLTLRALDMALQRRCPDVGLLHHSDQGTTYASDDDRARLQRHGRVCSMSRRGNCRDNAVMERWFATAKSEEGERFQSYAHAKSGRIRATSRSRGITNPSTRSDPQIGVTRTPT
jgi:transposase InsO family protein